MKPRFPNEPAVWEALERTALIMKVLSMSAPDPEEVAADPELAGAYERSKAAVADVGCIALGFAEACGLLEEYQGRYLDALVRRGGPPPHRQPARARARRRAR